MNNNLPAIDLDVLARILKVKKGHPILKEMEKDHFRRVLARILTDVLKTGETDLHTRLENGMYWLLHIRDQAFEGGVRHGDKVACDRVKRSLGLI